MTELPFICLVWHQLTHASLVNLVDKICQSLICSGVHMIDESGDEIDKPHTKRHVTAKDTL